MAERTPLDGIFLQDVAGDHLRQMTDDELTAALLEWKPWALHPHYKDRYAIYSGYRFVGLNRPNVIDPFLLEWSENAETESIKVLSWICLGYWPDEIPGLPIDVELVARLVERARSVAPDPVAHFWCLSTVAAVGTAYGRGVRLVGLPELMVEWELACRATQPGASASLRKELGLPVLPSG
jgi:hypothetical protein